MLTPQKFMNKVDRKKKKEKEILNFADLAK